MSERDQPKGIFCFQQSFFTLLLCLCAFQLNFKRICSLDSKPVASCDIETLRLRKKELEQQLGVEKEKARRLEAEIEQLEVVKREQRKQRLQELDRKGVFSTPQQAIMRKEAGPQYLSYDPEAIWQEVLDKERAIIERVDRALESGAQFGDNPQRTPFEEKLLKDIEEIIKGGEKNKKETDVKEESNLKTKKTNIKKEKQ